MFDKKGKVFGKRLLALLLAAAMTVTMAETPVSAAEAEMPTTATETGASAEGAVNPEGETTEEPDSGNAADTSEDPEENGESETPGNPGGGEETGDLGTPEEGSGTETPENPDGGEDTGNPGNPEEGNGVQTPDTPQEPSDDIGAEEPEEKTPEEQPGEETFDSVSENAAGAAAALLQGAELQADEDKASSGKINNISWRIESGTLTIEGTGDYIPDDGEEGPPWTGRDDVTSAVVRVTGLTSARQMFSGLSKLEKIDLTGLETSRVTDMSGMFAGCISLKNLDISKFQTSNVTDMSGMFAMCRLLSNLDVSGFDTKNVTNMSGMFSVGYVGELEQGDIDYINDGGYHSGYKNGRLHVDVSGFHTENVTDMSWMFAGCQGGVTLSPSGFYTAKVTDMNHMFYYSRVAGGNLSGFDTGRVTDMSYMFMKCGAVQNLNLNLSRFDTGNVENMERMFSGFYFGLPDPDFKSFNTGKVKNMIRMFEKCGGVKKLDLSSFETSRVSDMAGMFDQCRSLETLDLSSFDTGNTDSMGSMFSGCTSLRQLDLSSFDMGMRYYTDGTIGIGALEGLEYICAPVHCNMIEGLPVSTGRWYMEDGTECSVLPVGLSESIVLYKNGYPGDGKTRQIVSVSGISVKGKEYDGNPYTYEGTAAVTNAAGEEIPGVTLSGVYSGTLADGSVYEESETAPVRAGNYTLKFWVSGLDEKQYICRKTVYAFHIARREVTITAPSVNVPLGGPLPDLSALTCEVSEMAGADSLSKQPLLKYGTEESKIVLNKAGIYDIIPYGAAIADEAAGNYSITYKNGTLKIGDASDPSDEVVDSGKINGISWSIDKKGKLTVKGTGDYVEEEETVNDAKAGESIGGVKSPWAGDARIFTAEVNVSGITDTTGMFSDCKNLKSIELSGLNTGKVTNMYGMFEGCTALEKLDLAKFDTTKVKDMGYMFTDCRSLTKLDLRSFHTENVQVMYDMFEGCSRLADVDVSSFNTKNVGAMSRMFAGCVSLETLDISNFSMNDGWTDDMFHGCTSLKSLKMCEVRTRSIRNMFYSCTALQSLELRGSANDVDGVFKNCISLVKLDLSGFDTGEVVNMSGMFSGCSSLKNINLSGFDTGRVTDMSGMFSGCSSLKNINLSGFDTGRVTDMSEMFSGCSSLTNLNVSSFNTENVGGMSGMFRGCSSLVDLDVSGFHTEKLGSMDGMFEKCGSLTALDLSNVKTDQVESMSDMFRDCYSLASLNLNGTTAENARYMNGMFQNCSGLTDLDLSSFGEYAVEGYYDGRVVHDMFNGCTALTSLNLDGFGTAQSTDMSNMFRGCESLTGLDVSSFDTARVEDMSGMFAGCSSLTTLNLNNFNTRFVRDMSSMFEGCSSLTDVEVSSFDIGFLRNMSRMFADCSALTSLDLGSFQRPAVVNINRNADMSGMFSGCGSLADLDMRNFNMDRIYSYVNDLFAGCTSLSVLYAPINCQVNVPLPGSSEDQWKSVDGKIYKALPQKSESVLLYKNGYLDNPAGGLKTIVTVSGVSVRSKQYDGTANPYTGVAAAADPEGNAVPDLVFTYTYSGTMSDGTAYAQTADAPSQAGAYSLSVQLSGAAADQYVLRKNKYSFQIRQREVKITVSPLTIEPGMPVPAPVWEAEGFLQGEGWLKEPSFRYSPALATPVEPGRYQIIPYGADAGNNYRIRYVRGVLLVEAYGDILPGDLPSDGEIPEGLWIAGLSETGYAYTGKAIKPEVRVYDHKTLLKEKSDYTIAYKNNSKANTGSDPKTAPTIAVTGKGNYTGKETQTFRILPLDISGRTDVDGNENFAADDITVAYNKKEQKPVPTLIWNDKKLKNKTDFTFTYISGAGGGKLNSVKEPGVYWIELVGKGNFKGNRRLRLLVTDSLKPVSKLWVAGVKAQPYTGNAIAPQLTVKDEKTVLTENTHYTVAYSRNTAVGTAYAVVTGIEAAGYSGTKRISYKITGTPIKKAVVTGLSGKEFFYGGMDITPALSLAVPVKRDGVTTETTLREETDYTVDWQKNREAGTACVIFTGKGAYTGTLKKTFKIKAFDLAANADGRVTATLAQESVPYAKGGAKPALTLTFRQDDGSIRTLTEGKDYTLAFQNNKALNDGGDPEKLPAVKIKGKGSFKGTYGRVLSYQITRQDLGLLRVAAQDKTYRNKKNSHMTKVSVIDLDGRALKAGTDYDKNVIYTYRDETTVQTAPVKNVSAGGPSVRAAGTAVEKNDIIPAGTVLRVTVREKEGGNYIGTLSGEYRISKSSISTAAVSIPKQVYTGQEIILNKEDITVKVKGKPIDENQEQSQWEIVPDSYKNNVKKGTASVKIKGVDNYGGEKTVKFNIKAKGFSWWWR